MQERYLLTPSEDQGDILKKSKLIKIQKLQELLISHLSPCSLLNVLAAGYIEKKYVWKILTLRPPHLIFNPTQYIESDTIFIKKI